MTLSRKTPLKRVGSKVRRVLSPRCSKQRCNKIARAAGYCESHAKQVADTRFSLFIRERDPICVMRKVCDGAPSTQCCHVFSRRYGAVRFSPDNAVGGCAACHTYYTLRPDEWEAWRRDYLGAEHRDALWYRAQHAAVPDLGDVIEGLRKAAA